MQIIEYVQFERQPDGSYRLNRVTMGHEPKGRTTYRLIVDVPPAELPPLVEARVERLVHNHGPEEGPGIACRERVINGVLVGDCMRKDTVSSIDDMPVKVGKVWPYRGRAG